jgi:hypothetical protein
VLSLSLHLGYPRLPVCLRALHWQSYLVWDQQLKQQHCLAMEFRSEVFVHPWCLGPQFIGKDSVIGKDSASDKVIGLN